MPDKNITEVHHIIVQPPVVHRSFITSLVFEQDGDLNLSTLILIFLSATGILGFIWANILCKTVNPMVEIASWSWLGATSMAVLIGALPIAKAKILAKSSLPAQVAKGISESAMGSMQSTDLQEGYMMNQGNMMGNNNEFGNISTTDIQ